MGPISIAVLLPICLFLTCWAAREAIRAVHSASWPTAPGTITASPVDRVKQRASTSRDRHRFRYEYAIGDNLYQASRRSFRLAPWEKRPRELARRYPPGKTVAVYYHPEKPRLAAIEPGASVANFIAVGLLLAADAALASFWLDLWAVAIVAGALLLLFLVFLFRLGQKIPGPWSRGRPRRPDTGDPLYQDLLRKARGDAALVARLIAYERRLNPDAPRRELIRQAIYRWERDNR